MMRVIYSLLLYLLLPAVLIRLLWRSIKAPQYRQRWLQRFGCVSPQLRAALSSNSPIIWLHTVSVGESIAAQPLASALLARYPHCQLVITTSTPTGSMQITRMFASELALNKIVHSYIPYDLPDCVARFLTAIRPCLAIFMETEIWPNIISHCQQRYIPTVLLNARLSAKSHRAYQRLAGFSRSIFSRLTAIAAQTDIDAKRFHDLGARSVTVVGSLKAELVLSQSMKRQAYDYKQRWSLLGQRKIILAASTHSGEDELILQLLLTLKARQHNVLGFLVPRHPERFASVEALIANRGLQLQRRSELVDGEDVGDTVDIILGDTLGELLLLCGVADVVIMGGTFVPHGGHNFLEPAAWGVPIVSGNSDYNFAHIARALAQCGALTQLVRHDELLSEVETLLLDDTCRQKRGAAGQAYLENSRGALDKHLALLDSFINS